MATYSDITEIKLLPIKTLEIWVDNGDSTTTQHAWVGTTEKESSWNADPITMRDHRGLDVPVAVKFTANIYLPQTDWQDKHPTLIDLLDKPLVRWKLKLGGVGTGEGFANATLEVDTVAAFAAMSQQLTWRWEKIEWRPRMIITITGRYSLDCLRSTTNRFFAQGTGF